MTEENSTNLTEIWWKPSVLHGDTDFQRNKMPGAFDKGWVVVHEFKEFQRRFVTFPGSTYSVLVGTSQNQRRVELGWLGLVTRFRENKRNERSDEDGYYPLYGLGILNIAKESKKKLVLDSLQSRFGQTPEVYPLTVSMFEVLAFVMGAGSKTPGTGLVLPCEALAHKPSSMISIIFLTRLSRNFLRIGVHCMRSSPVEEHEKGTPSVRGDAIFKSVVV
ncbi:hypothetical protein C8J57DRAFT_1237065 [Mycena rebaudengoi]|nr:hypothetical protein C8J57DRAFT_1237065 [Mycena rebaudengoi]